MGRESMGASEKSTVPAGAVTGGSLLSLERAKKIDQIAGQKMEPCFSFSFSISFSIFWMQVEGGRGDGNRYEKKGSVFFGTDQRLTLECVLVSDEPTVVCLFMKPRGFTLFRFLAGGGLRPRPGGSGSPPSSVSPAATTFEVQWDRHGLGLSLPFQFIFWPCWDLGVRLQTPGQCSFFCMMYGGLPLQPSAVMLRK